jgi:hypothetical protein
MLQMPPGRYARGPCAVDYMYRMRGQKMRTPLVQLLFPGGGLSGDDNTVFGEAYLEITSLRHKLDRQSTQLAEALKLKNDAFSREATIIHQLEQARRERDEANLRTQQACKKLSDELVEVKAQLKKLQPLEPRFRVGQVVMSHHVTYGYCAMQISKSRFVEGVYKYTCSITGLEHTESNLRALKDDEK